MTIFDDTEKRVIIMNGTYKLVTMVLLISSIIQQTAAFDIQSDQKLQSTIQSINDNPPPALLLNFRNWLKTPEEGTSVLQTLLNGINDAARQQITEIIIESARFGALPDLAGFHNLQKLEITGNDLANVSLQLKLPASLKELHLANNGLTQPPSISGANNLEKLNLAFNALHEIPDLTSIQTIKELNVSNNQISSLLSMAHLEQLKTLKLTNNQLTGSLNLSGLTNLTELFLSHNRLTTPPILVGLNNLWTLGLSNNQLTSSPVLTNLTQLRNLYLSNNQIAIPPDLQGLSRLTTLNLSSNPLVAPLQIPSTLNRSLRIIGVPTHLITYLVIHDPVELHTLITKIVSAIYTTEAVPENLIQTIINQAQPELNSPDGITQEQVQALINEEVERRRQESMRQHLAALSEQQKHSYSLEDRTPVELSTNPEYALPVFFSTGSLPNIRQLIRKQPVNILLQPAKGNEPTLINPDITTRTLEESWHYWKSKEQDFLPKFLNSLKGVDLLTQETFLIERSKAEIFLKELGLPDTTIATFMRDNREQYLELNQIVSFIEEILSRRK